MSTMDASTSQSLATFEHDTLPDAAGYIRLLQVLDDKYSENIKLRCEMTTWPMDNKPSYHAISYTWGDPASNTTILINGKAFQTRTNCEYVLKQAYWFEKTYYYWVDAICINQGDLEEKSKQVSKMGSIYESAAHVLAYVGDHADDSAFLSNKLKQRAFTRLQYPRDSAMRLSLRFQLGQRFSTTMRFLHAAICFVERPYFTRLWILQELRNAQEATFLCGTDLIPKRVIYDMSEGILNQSMSIRKFGKFFSVATNIAKRFPLFRRFWTMQEYWRKLSIASKDDDKLFEIARRAWLVVGSKTDLSTLILAATSLQCQERKDKIFGLISLIDWSAFTPIIPDYTHTEFEVAVHFFQALLNAQSDHRVTLGTFNLLRLCNNVVLMLALNIKSSGIPSALQSRHIETGPILAGGESAVEFTHSRHEISTGWRVSSEHLFKSDLGLSIWSPQGSEASKVYLPFWAKGGDWVVLAEQQTWTFSKRYVVVREVAEGFGGPLVGHAVSHGISAEKAARANFGIHWDPEDIIIYTMVEFEMMDMHFEIGQYSAEWIRMLNTAVCRKQTPSSSYAVRCNDTSCQPL